MFKYIADQCILIHDNNLEIEMSVSVCLDVGPDFLNTWSAEGRNKKACNRHDCHRDLRKKALYPYMDTPYSNYFRKYTLRKFRQYNKASLRELVPLEILGKYQQG